MAKIRRILALVLVMAMTFTMLPVFAAAEDVVSEIPAVETVEAPAAEAPVVEAPADVPAVEEPAADAPVVEAPVVDVPAVEDVVEIPTEAPVEEPAVEAIETVAAEAVAELQEAVVSGASYTNGVQSTGQSDEEAVAAGYIAKLVHTLGTEDASDDEVYFYTSLPNAITDACAWTSTGGTAYLLTDYTFLSTSASAPFAVWTGNPDYSSEGGVNGFWFDLNGKTLIVRKPGALFGYNKNFQNGAGYAVTPWLNIRNGKVFHFNQSGTSGTSTSITNVMGSVQLGFSYWAYASSSAPNYGIAYPHLTLKDVEYALLSIGTDMPLFNTLAWNASIDLYDSKFINASLNESGNADDGTQSGSAICIIPSINMRPSSYKSDSTKAATLLTNGETGNYTINLHGTSVLGSLHATKPVVHYDAVTRLKETGNYSCFSPLLAPKFTITADPGSRFLGSDLLTSDYTVDFHQAPVLTPLQGEKVDSTFMYEKPSRAEISVATETATNADYFGRLDAAPYATFTYCTHATRQHFDATEPTYGEVGMQEHWYCACGTYWAADGETKTTREALEIPVLEGCPHSSKTFVEEFASTCSEAGMAAHYVCDGCGAYFTEGGIETTRDNLLLELLPHELEAHDPVPATFLAVGDSAYWSCAACGKFFSDAEATTEIDEYSWVGAIPKLDTTLTGELLEKSDAELAALGAVAKVVEEGGDTVVYPTLPAAYTAAGEIEGVCNVVLLRDTVIIPTDSGGYGYGAITDKVATKSTYKSWGTENTTDAETTVNGFWLDLNDHTVTVRAKNSASSNLTGAYPAAIYALESIPVNIKNGTIIYRFCRSTQRTNFGLITIGFGSSGDNYSQIGTEEEIFTPSITIKDAKLIRVHDGGDNLNLDQANNRGPVIAVKDLASEINIIRSSIIASSSENGAINYAKNAYATTGPATAPELAHNLTITDSCIGVADVDATTAIYAGSIASGYQAECDLNITVNGNVEFVAPEAVKTADGGPELNFTTKLKASTESIALPDVADMRAYEATQYDVKPDYLAAVECASLIPCDHAAKGFVEEDPASYTEAGFAAHYYCSDCGTYWDAEENETTREALVLSVVPCPHAAAENVPAVPATFLEGGKIEHWSCGDCNRLFSDEDLTVEITEAELETEIRPTTDTEGLETDEDFAQLGAVVVTTHPDEGTIAYTGNTALNDAYKHAAGWTKQGGVVRVVTNYTVYNITRDTTGYITSGAETKATNHSYAYENADRENERYAGLDLKGFWLDLGGHTLVFRTGRPLFGAQYSLPVNIKNGTIIYQNTAAVNNYGVFKNGTTSTRLNSADEIYRPAYTLDGVTLLEVAYAPKSETGTTLNVGNICLFHVGATQSQINLIDSVIINDRNNVIRYTETAPAANEELDTFRNSKGYQHVVNLRGNTVVGAGDGYSVFTTDEAVGHENSGAEADYIRVNAEDGVKFLGSSVAGNVKGDLNLRSFLPTDYTEAAEKYSIAMPDVSKFVQEKGTYIGEAIYENLATETEYTAWVKGDPANAAAKVTVSGDDYTMYVQTAGEAVQRAENLGRVGYEATATLLADTAVVETAAIGGANATSEFTLDLNGKALTGEALVEANGGEGTKVTMNVVDSTETLNDVQLNVLKYAGAQTFPTVNKYVIDKNYFFDSYSLNLENTISVNLYTKNDPDAVCYVQDGEDQTPVKNAENDWTVTTLAAKDMGKTIDAYAIKTDGTTTTIDFSKGISVKGYVTNKAAEGDNTDALKNALAAMLIYGKYANKYFDNDYAAIDDALAYVNETGLELTEVPVDYDISSITEDRVVTPDDLDISSATTGVWGYRGTSAVLADEISMKLYFYGAEFDPAHVTINGAAATEEQVKYVDNFTTVKVSVNAKEFDTAIEIALNDGIGHAVTVTDSVAAYAKRLLEDESNSNVHNVAQAMLNYCYYTQQHFNSNP